MTDITTYTIDSKTGNVKTRNKSIKGKIHRFLERPMGKWYRIDANCYTSESDLIIKSLYISINKSVIYLMPTLKVIANNQFVY